MSLEVNISEPDEFNSVELHSSIKQVANKKGFENFKYHVDCISGNRANFIANVFRVVIRDSEDDEQNFSVIVKTLVNSERQELFNELHEREVIAYNNVISKFNEIQSVIEEKLRVTVPECLYSSTKSNNEVIILNDLNSEGFYIDDKITSGEYLTSKQINRVIIELSKFHALSLVMEIQKKDEFEGIKSKFNDIVFQNDFLNKSKLKDYFLDSFDLSLTLVADGEVKKKLKEVKENLLKLLQMYTKPGKLNVLCHGDCWVNNILFKDEESTQPKICFIDYQAMRYANPMTDLMYFLYICTGSQIRSEYLQHFKVTYYNSLKNFLSLFDIDVNKLYNTDDFNTDWEEFQPYGLLIAMVELRIVTMTPEEDPILKGSRLTSNWDVSHVPGESDWFRHRVNDLVEEAVNTGVLNRLLETMNNL